MYSKKLIKTDIQTRYKIPLDKKTQAKLKKKHRCWQRFMETRSGEDHKRYTQIRNQVRNITRKLQREKEKDIAKKAKANPKPFWKYAIQIQD